MSDDPIRLPHRIDSGTFADSWAFLGLLERAGKLPPCAAWGHHDSHVIYLTELKAPDPYSDGRGIRFATKS